MEKERVFTSMSADRESEREREREREIKLNMDEDLCVKEEKFSLSQSRT